MSDLISVIVPIYNSEKTLKRCLESIMYQTYSNIEIVLINDGSIDNSKNICEGLVKKDNRIILINKENEGVGKARNLGLEKASGKYITFVDSDDYIEKYAIENLYNILIENKVQAVRGNYNIITKKGTLSNEEPRLNKLYNKENIHEFIYEILTEHVKSFLWLLLVEKDVIKDKFCEELFLYEDVNFYLSILGNIETLYVSSKITYNYVITENSLSRATDNYDLKINELLKANKILKQTLKQYGLDTKENIEAFDTSIVNNIINYLYYKYKIIKKSKNIFESFDKLKSNEDFINILNNYKETNLSQKAKMYNDTLINKKYFKFIILSKIKNILGYLKG